MFKGLRGHVHNMHLDLFLIADSFQNDLNIVLDRGERFWRKSESIFSINMIKYS